MLGRGDLLLGRDPSVRFLPLIIGFMVFLSVLALAGVFAANQMVDRWDKGLSQEVTVQIPVPPDGGGATQADRVAQAVRYLEGIAGIAEVRELGEDELSGLIEPWLGQSDLLADLPLPSLIAVSLDPDQPPDLATLARQLDDAVPGAVLDTHERWMADLLRLARAVELGAAVLVILVGLAAIASVVFVTRTGLAVHQQVIEVLNLIGAQDTYVARQFQRHALWLGLKGGALGLILGGGILYGAGYLLSTWTPLMPQVAFSPWQWAGMAAVPLVVALIAMYTARITVLRTLARMS